MASQNSINNTVPDNDLTVSHSNSGGDAILSIDNASNTASSRALHKVQVAGTSAGDALTNYSVSGSTQWGVGLDNSDSDAFVISQSSTLGTNNIMHSTTSGEITYPLQPAFLARRSTGQTTLSANNTLYTVTYNSEIFDQNGDYDGTNTFTAPVTGRYFFSCNVEFYTGGTETEGNCLIITSNRQYSCIYGNLLALRSLGPGGTNRFSVGGSTYADMDASDTCVVKVALNKTGGSTTYDIQVGGVGMPFFSGFLHC